MLSFAIALYSFVTGDARPFGKQQTGKRSIFASIVLGPYLVINYAAWLCIHIPPYNSIYCFPETDHGGDSSAAAVCIVALGQRLRGLDHLNKHLQHAHNPAGTSASTGGVLPVDFVVDLCAEFAESSNVLRGCTHYVSIPTVDTLVPDAVVCAKVLKRLARYIKSTAATNDKRGSVYIHCANGRGRSAVFAAGLLLLLKGWSPPPAKGRASAVHDACDAACDEIHRRRTVTHLASRHREWLARDLFPLLFPIIEKSTTGV